MADCSQCAICNCTENTWRHARVDYNMAKAVWCLVDEDLVDHLKAVNNPNARIWLMDLQESMGQDDLAKVLVLYGGQEEELYTRGNFSHRCPLFSFITRFLSDRSCCLPSLREILHQPLGMPRLTGSLQRKVFIKKCRCSYLTSS